MLSDLWSGGNEGRALELEFFERIRSTWLRPNGTLAVNLIAFAEGAHPDYAGVLFPELKLPAERMWLGSAPSVVWPLAQ